MLTKKSKIKRLIQLVKYGISIAVIIYQSIQKKSTVFVIKPRDASHRFIQKNKKNEQI